VLAAAGYHYKNAMLYTKNVHCKVVFVNYRLAPRYPFPVFFEDCYAAARWVYENSEKLGIDVSRIGIGGDSAGSTLALRELRSSSMKPRGRCTDLILCRGRRLRKRL